MYRVVSTRQPATSQPPLTDDEDVVWIEDVLPEAEYAHVAGWLSGRPATTLHLADRAEDLSALVHFRGLQSLLVTNLRLRSWDGVALVADSLRHLAMGDTTLRPISLAPLSALTDLHTLGLVGPAKDGDVVGGMRDLRSLALRSVRLDHAHALPRLTKLEQLSLQLSGVTGENLGWLRELPVLRDLNVWRLRGVNDVRAVGELPSLERLYLQSMSSVRVLPSFAGAASLTTIVLDTMKGITDLTGVAAAPVLEELALIDMPQLDPEALRPLVGHPTLREARVGLGSVRRNAAAYDVLPLGDPPYGHPSHGRP